MGRWPDDAQERLQRAAIELFAEHGYGRTTVAGIAARAGLTERTFYNHFADKREVLFPGQDRFIAETVQVVSASSDRPLDAIVTALAARADWFDERRDAARIRRRILDAHAELQEREHAKSAALAAALAEALVTRGIAPTPAAMTAASAVSAFRLAAAAWLDDPARRGLEQHLRATVEELRRTAEDW